jgi:lipopolysaccharide biosynthesis glycosyltransferase
MTIDLVTSSDKNYGQHTGIMLTSLLATQNPENEIRISILDGGILPSDREKINRIFLKYGKALPQYISIHDKYIGNVKIDGHVSIATYYRVLLPKIFPNLEKILYLDSDVVVTAPLDVLWSTDINNYYAAAIQDSGAPDEKHYTDLGLPGVAHYFNAGVLLINLKKWRQDGIEDKLIEIIHTRHSLLKFWDQDAINSLLWRKVKIIDPKFNVMVHFLKKHHQSIYSNNEIKNAIKHPVIVHYNSQDKPWNTYCQNKLKNNYRSYLKKSEWKEESLKHSSFTVVIKSFLLNHLHPAHIKWLKKVKNRFYST